MINTLLLVLGSCALAVPLGTLLALLLTRTDLPWRGWWLALFSLLLFIPLYLQAAGWDAGFGRLGWQGGGERDDWLVGRRAVIWIHGLAGLPWVVLIVASGLRTVNSAAEEAALLAGSNWQVLRHITLHRVTGAILLATLWVALTVATESTVADIYAVPTFARNLFVWASGLQQHLSCWDVVLGNGCLFLIAVSTLMLFVRIAARQQVTATRPPPRFALGRTRSVFMLFVISVFVVAVAVPLLNLVLQAGEQSFTGGTSHSRVWSVQHFAETIALTMQRFSGEFGWTVLIAATAATLGGVVGLPLAWMAQRGGLRTLPAILATVVGLGLPAPLLAQSVIWLLNRDDPEWLKGIFGEHASIFRWFYDRSILAPTLSVGLRCLPATTMVMWFAFRSIGGDQLETATLEGAGSLRRLTQIAVPQRLFSLLTAWWIGFAVASGDVTTSILVLPPGIDTVPVRVFGLLHAGVDEQVAGLCLVSVVGYLSMGGLIYCSYQRWFRKNGAEPNRAIGV